MSWRPSWWLKALKLYWPLNRLIARASSAPGLGALVRPLVRPLFNPKSFNVSYIPIQATIPPPVSTVLARSVIGELIRASAHRVIVRRCTCRDSEGCRTYPIEEACLLLGEDTRLIGAQMVRPVSVEEALAHLDSRLALGLVPMTGRVRVDDLYYGVPNRGRMLTICFCCPCCCTVLNSARYFPEEFRGGLVKLQGVRLEVDAARCQGCGACAAACFTQAITLQDGHAVHAEDKCLGCGRCVTVCPTGATRLDLADSQAAIKDLLGRIRERVDVA
jgi:UDP-glucose 4-epimerase